MELDEFHVLQRQARAQHHRIAIAGAGMRRGAGEISAAIAAGRKNRLVGAEAVHFTGRQIHRHDAATGAVFHDQIDGEIFDVEFSIIFQALAIERVQHGVAGAVGGGAGALRRRAFAEFGGHAAERALIDLALLCAGKRHAEMVELVNRLRALHGTDIRSRPDRRASPTL